MAVWRFGDGGAGGAALAFRFSLLVFAQSVWGKTSMFNENHPVMTTGLEQSLNPNHSTREPEEVAANKGKMKQPTSVSTYKKNAQTERSRLMRDGRGGGANGKEEGAHNAQAHPAPEAGAVRCPRRCRTSCR